MVRQKLNFVMASFRLFRTQLLVGLFMLIAGAVRIAEAANADGTNQWKVEFEGDDVWLKLSSGGSNAFALRLGAGGAVSEIKGGGQSLLSPSFQGEVTDRIMQWTIWSDTVTNRVASLPKKFEWRFNVTQGGCFDGTISPTTEVWIDAGRGIVDVYSVPQDQWKTEQREAMRCQLSCLTRYEMKPDGVLLIRRWIRVGDLTLNGQRTAIADLQVESWNPFLRRAAAFDAVALGLDEQGNPTKVHSTGAGFPHYPKIPADQTAGWAVVFNQHKLTNAPCIAVVFGRENPLSHGGKQELNLMQWRDGLAVLPKAVFRNVEPGSVLEHSLVLVFRSRFDARSRDQLNVLAKTIPPPKLWRPTGEKTREIVKIAEKLAGNEGVVGMRTEHLGTLIQPDRPPPQK